MNGMLLVDKPTGWTSFDVVNKVRRIIEQSGLNTTGKKRFPVGHTGTLDPLATGLLVLLLGNATKQAPALTKLDKTYEVTMRLGQTSTTGDEEGDKQAVSGRVPTADEVEAALRHFVGESLQTPPQYSAIKVNGQRAYKLARAGQTIELKPRPIRVDAINLRSYQYPLVEWTAHVSSGTYIRSMVEDIGARLHTGAYMTALRRMTIGEYSVTRAIPVAVLNTETIGQAVQPLSSDK